MSVETRPHPSGRSPRDEPWTARALSLLATAAAAVAAATCGGNVRVDDDSAAAGGGDGGAAQQGPGPTSVGPGTTGPGTTGPGTTGPGTTGPGTTGPGTTGPGPTSSSTGGGDCLTCGEYLSDCTFSDVPADKCFDPVWCRISGQLYNELVGCVCSACQMDCANTCAGMSGDDPDECGNCQIESIQSGPCSAPFAECSNDV